MRILFSFENQLPNAQADAEVFVNTAGALARRGHPARLAVPRGDTAPAAVAAAVRNDYGLTGPLEIAGIDGWSAHIGLQHLYHAGRVPALAREFGADVVYTRNLAVVTACIAAGQPVAFDHYRPWGDQVPPLQAPIHRLMAAEAFVGMVCHSEVAKASYARIGVPAERLRVIHNGYDPRRMGERLSKAAARRHLGLDPTDRIAVYTGRVNHRKGLDTVLAMARSLPHVQFLLVGSTGDGPVEREAAGMANVTPVPWQPFAATAAYLYAADVLLVPPSAAPLQRHGNTVLPLKVFLYLAAGRPILAGDTPDVREVLADDRNALLVPPGDVAAAAAALDRLCRDGRLRQRLGTAARHQAKGLTWDARAERIEAFLTERLAAPGRARPQPLNVGRWLTESAGWLGSVARHRHWVDQSWPR